MKIPLNKKITPKSTSKKLDELPNRENMSEQDKKFYSDVGSAILENELALFIDNKQWVLGIITMAIMLDFVGKTKLIWHHKGLVSSNRILRYKFIKTIAELRNSNIIDEQTFNKMEEIRNTRNSFAHDLLRQWSLSSHPNPKLEKLIRDGIKIIKTLFVT